MPTKCKIIKDNIQTIEDNDQLKEQESVDESIIVRINEKLIDGMYSEFLPGSEITETQATEFLNKYWGTEQEVIASKIEALLDGHTIVQEMFAEYVFEHLPVGVMLKKGERRLDLTTFPIKSLKLYYNFLFNLVTQTSPTGEGYMNFGGVLSVFKTPRKLARWEPTGAYFHIAKATKDFPRSISHNINTFMTDVKGMKQLVKSLNKNLPKDEKLEVPRMGMNQIYSKLEYLLTDVGDSYAVQQLFHRYMMGWIYQDEDGDFMIYKDYDKVPIIRDKKIIGYEKYEDGSYIFKFQNPVKLSQYENKGQGIKKGDLNVVFRGKGLSEFINLTEEARKIDDLVFHHSKKYMKQSLDRLLSSLVKYMNMNEADLKAIFFRPESKKAENIMATLNDKQLKKFHKLKEIFETKISDEFIMANGGRIDMVGDAEYKKNHFPVIYHRWAFTNMLDKMIGEFEVRVSELNDIVKDPKVSGDMKKVAIKELAEYKAKLRNAESIRDNYDGYHQDVNNDVLLSFTRDAKHFKRISNAYDIRSARVDTAVYYDYLKNLFSAPERNNLAAILVESLNLTDSESVNLASINMFKIPFADPTIEGLFGVSVKDIAEKTGMNPERLERRLRKISSYLTFAYLGGFMTPITNVSAIQQNVFDYGFKETMRAFKLLRGENSQKIQEIVQMSGITEFSDFFSRSMVNGVVEVQLEQDVAHKLIGHMILYHDRIKRGMSRAKSRKIFNEEVQPILENSTAWLDAEGLAIPEKERLKMRKKELRSDWLQTTLNKLIQFSIEKEFEFKKALNNVPVSAMNKITSPIKNVAQKLGMFYGATLKNIGVTMSDTESFIRTLSFIIGVNRAWDGQYLPNDRNWWDYDAGSQELAEVLSIGALLSEFTNFGLSSQSVPRIGHGAVGKLLVKFKNWPMQKFSRDTSMIYNAYVENKELIKIERNAPGFFKTFDPKAVGTVLKKLVELPKSDRRLTDPQMAAMRNWFWVQGPITILWDFFIAGPWKLPGGYIASYFYGGVIGKSTRNFTSDLISFMFMPLNIFGSLFIQGYWDDDEAERALTYYLRRTMLGYVPMSMWDFFISMLYATNGNPTDAVRKAPIPAPPSVTKIGKMILEDVVD